MAEQEIINLGIVGISNKGQYNSETDYERLNVVTYNGSSYCATQNSKGKLPTNTEFWQLYAEKGETGETGPQGPQGPAPVKGVDYYTVADKTEIENDLSASIHQEVSEQVGSLVSATPLSASSVSDMTDTTRIYVNTTDGNWYYYDGSGWVVGGIYQATQIGEKSVSLLQLTDDLTSILNLNTKNVDISIDNQQGTIMANDGSNSDSNTRYRTRLYYYYNEPIIINCNNGYKLRVYEYDSTGQFILVTPWLEGENIINTIKNHRYRFLYGKSDDTAINNTEVVNNITFKKMINEIFEKEDTKLILDIKENLITGLEWVVGAIQASDGTNNDYIDNRIRSNMISFNNNIKIKINDGYRFMYYKYSTSELSSYIGNTGWFTDDTIIEINKDYYYRFSVMKNNEYLLNVSDSENINIYEFENNVNYEMNKEFETVTVSTYNVGHFAKGLSDMPTYTIDDLQDFRNIMTELNSDIVLLSENDPYFDASSSLPIYANLYSLFKYYATGIKNGYNCNAIVSNYHLSNFKQTQFTQHPNRYFYEAECVINNKTIHLISTQCSFEDINVRHSQFNELINVCNNYEYFILAGDFNPSAKVNNVLPPDTPINAQYKDDYKMFTDEGYNIANVGYFGDFNTLISGEIDGLIKPWDNIITSSNIRIKNCKVIKSEMSDHYPIIAEINIY